MNTLTKAFLALFLISMSINVDMRAMDEEDQEQPTRTLQDIEQELETKPDFFLLLPGAITSC